MHDQRHSDSNCCTRRNQYSRRGAVLDYADARMGLRVQMVREVLQSSIEELRCEYYATREQNQPPPDRLHAQDCQRNYNTEEEIQLKPEVLLAPPRGHQARPCELQPSAERLILVAGHREFL